MSPQDERIIKDFLELCKKTTNKDDLEFIADELEGLLELLDKKIENACPVCNQYEGDGTTEHPFKTDVTVRCSGCEK